MADNKQMKLKIEYDNINTAEKPIKSLVNFFTNNCVLRILNKIESEDLMDTEPLEIPIKDNNNWNLIDDTIIVLYLGEDYDKFNGKCNLIGLTLNSEPASGTDPDVSFEGATIPLEGFIDLKIKDGKCEISYEDLVNAIPEGVDISDVSSVKVQLTSEIKTSIVANIINDNQLDYQQIGIASIKYENKSGESNDVALVQDENANPVIDCDTKFVKANTALKFYTMDLAEAVSEDDVSVDDNVNLLPMEIPVTITPYYDGKENKDADIIPKFEYDDPETDIDESIIQNHEITKKNLPVDWKLRTTTFTLQSESASYDVFYKVGFCPADGKESTEKEVINALKVYTFTVNSDKFTLEYPAWAAYKFDFNKRQQWQQFYITGKPTWLPVYQHDEFNGIMYIELYNSEDGSKFTDDIKEFRVMINRDNPDDFYAPLKDYMLDKGNIPSVAEPTQPS